MSEPLDVGFTPSEVSVDGLVEVRLPFERFNHVLAVAATDANQRVQEDLIVSSKILKFVFSEYIKSQIHLNISLDLIGIPMSEYVVVLDFLRGSVFLERQAEKLLRQFYKDIANFLLKNPKPIFTKMEIDGVWSIGTKQITLGEAVEKFQREFEEFVQDPVKMNDEYVCRIVEAVDSIEDVYSRMANCAIAYVLLQECDASEVRLLEIGL